MPTAAWLVPFNPFLWGSWDKAGSGGSRADVEILCTSVLRDFARMGALQRFIGTHPFSFFSALARECFGDPESTTAREA